MTPPPPAFPGDRTGPFPVKAIHWAASTVFVVAHWANPATAIVVTSLQVCSLKFLFFCLSIHEI